RLGTPARHVRAARLRESRARLVGRGAQLHSTAGTLVTETPAYRHTFARLLGFLRPYKVSLVVSIVLAVASQGAQIALIWVTKHVIDGALSPHDARKLWLFVAAIVTLGLARALLMAARRL